MRVSAIDHAAVNAGVAIGMTLTDVRARMPGLQVFQMDRQADDAHLHACALAAEIFTPMVALDGSDGLILDITGCAHLFGGEAGLSTRVRQCFGRFGLTMRISIAGTPQAAHAFSRFGKQEIIASGMEATSARVLPVTALEADTETTIALTRAGLKTLGDLADRPIRMLSSRFGEDLTAKFQRILGREDIRITPVRPLPDCMAERHFPDPMMDTLALETVLTQLARDVCEVLERRGSGGRRFSCQFFRSDGIVRRLGVETSAPCRNVEAILRLFRLRMETLADPLDPGFGFDVMRLAVSVIEPIAPLQSSLDGKAEDETSISDLVDRLVVRFGRDRVLQFAIRDTHDPVRAGGIKPAIASSAPGLLPSPEPGEPPLRPIQLFTSPQPIEVLAEVPDAPPLRFRWRHVLHEIARADGPERIAPDWWLGEGMAPATRDYYRIEDAAGRRFWVFREGLYGEDARPRWFMHGLFA